MADELSEEYTDAFEQDALDAFEDVEQQDDQQDALPVHQGPPAPVPVEHTSQYYREFKTDFGDDQEALLSTAWGDHALTQDRIVGALLEDRPEIGNIYEQHQSDSGGLSAEGAQVALQYLFENSKHETPEDFIQANPELVALHNDYTDEAGTLSPAGVRIILAHVATRTGYKAAYRAKR